MHAPVARLGVMCTLFASAAALKIIRGKDEAAGAARVRDVCDGRAGLNAIARENCREGADAVEWEINGAGHPSIQGFADEMSYSPGGSVDVRVKTDATAYRIDVYRVGYYGGKGARLVQRDVAKVIEPPHAQPRCKMLEEEALLIDCANWDVNARWTVPGDAVSGVYFMRLTRTDRGPRDAWRTDASSIAASPKFANPDWDYSTPPPCGWPPADGDSGAYERCVHDQHHNDVGAGLWRKGTFMANALREPFASHIYFVVKAADGTKDHAAMVFQTSDTTWHAYNTYGSPNTYGLPALPHHWEYFPFGPEVTAAVNRRSYKRSYNVPLLTRDTRAVNMLWQCEYPMIRWLERNGYDVTYISGVDTDRGAVLENHKLFLSVGHDEYWATAQRARVEAARDVGLHLAFFSGNELYWRIRWEADRRIMVVYKETQASSKLDPEPASWTGTWRDSSHHNPLGGQPENSVTGTLWTVNAWRNDALVVPYPYSKLRFWRHTATAAANLEEGDRAVLLKGLLGHEWDSDVDNGQRPRGLVRLSETTINNVQHVFDAGATFDSGTATHHLVLYKNDAGAIVFGAGTVQWMWGLDPHHDSQTGIPNELENQYNTRIGYDETGPEPCIQQATVNLFADMGVMPSTPEVHLVLDVAACGRVPPPTCSITSIEVDGTNVTVKGTAEVHADALDSLIGAVEVTLDGNWWHPVATRLAQRTVAWTATFDHENSASQLTCRATDDCLNTGTQVCADIDVPTKCASIT